MQTHMADRPEKAATEPNKHMDPDWLRKKYHGEGLSLNDIADIVEKSYGAVWRQFDRHGIERRNNANHVEMTDELLALLDGLLAGDGCLAAENRAANYRHGDSYEEFIDWLEAVLESHGLEVISRRTHEESDWVGYHLTTRAYRELLGVEGRWYPDGEKRLPPDFELSPTTLLMWYVGDGSYIPQNHGEHNVVIYSDNFTDQRSRIECLFRDEVGVGASYMQQAVYIPTRDHEQFFDYMLQSDYGIPAGYEGKFPG